MTGNLPSVICSPDKRDKFSRKKNMKIQSGCETMRKAASKEQGENEGQ